MHHLLFGLIKATAMSNTLYVWQFGAECGVEQIDSHCNLKTPVVSTLGSGIQIGFWFSKVDNEAD